MILDAIVGLLSGLLSGLLGLFPAWQVPSVVTGFSTGVGSWVGTVNQFFPLMTIGACVAVVLGVRLVSFGIRLAVWVWELIPFKAT